MALIGMAVWDTEANGRTEMTNRTLASLYETVDWARHRLFISDNGSCQATQELYAYYTGTVPFELIQNGENIGTANAINRAWAHREPGEHCVKMDNDVVIHYPGWADLMERVFEVDSQIGIVGLKRKDVDECPTSDVPWYKSSLAFLSHEKGEVWTVLEFVKHVMGTCQGYSSCLLDEFGYLYQMGSVYGFDDALASLRAERLGYLRAFVPEVQIDHIDPGAGEYGAWKRAHAAEWMGRFNEARIGYTTGTLPLYYDGGDSLRAYTERGGG